MKFLYLCDRPKLVSSFSLLNMRMRALPAMLLFKRCLLFLISFILIFDIMTYKNNPFNIRRNKSNRWFGSIASGRDKFESFSSLVFGVRAFFILLRTYYVNYHLRSIYAIIMRYAPPSENPTYNYIEYVCRKFEENVPLFQYASERAHFEITNKQEVFVLAQAMALFESGTALPDSLLEKVWSYYHIETSKFPTDEKFDICSYPPLPSG